MVTTPTVRMPRSRAHLAMIGAAPVPVPPPMPAVMNTMCAPSRCSPISGIDSSAALIPTSGWAPAPRPWVTVVPSWMRRSVLEKASCWASVFATTNSTPSRCASIMLLTALPPAPPTPNTTIRGFSSVSRGAVNAIAIGPCVLRKSVEALTTRPRSASIGMRLTKRPPSLIERKPLTLSRRSVDPGPSQFFVVPQGLRRLCGGPLMPVRPHGARPSPGRDRPRPGTRPLRA